jgi:HEAT repeat protein
MKAALRALNDPAPEVRREAVTVLGYLKAEQAIPALMTTANDDDASVRRAVMSALVFSRPGGPGASALLAGLTDSHWQVREEAAASIGKIKLPDAAGALMSAMTDETWQVRAKAANALGRIRDTRAVPVLGQALSHEVSNLRKEAAAALGEIADPPALIFLERATGDPDPDVRKLVRWAIERCQAA